MAGVSVGVGSGARRGVDSEINMVPMIDLLMVTISFLLITAVWTHFPRMEATANVPGDPAPVVTKPSPRLHVDMRDPARFVLHWNEGATVVRTREVPRAEHPAPSADKPLRFPELAAALAEEHRAAGAHVAKSDRELDSIVLHTRNDEAYASIIAAMDAAYAVKRPGPAGAMPAFAITLAAN